MSSCEYCKQVAPTCNKQINCTYSYTLHRYPINFCIYCIAAAPDPARDYCMQITALKLKQPNLG